VTTDLPAPPAQTPPAPGEAGVVRVLDALRLTRSRVSAFRVRLAGLPSVAGSDAAARALAEAGVVEPITPDQLVVLVIDPPDPSLAEARVLDAVRRFLAAGGQTAVRAEVAVLHRPAGQIEDAEDLLLALAAAPARVVVATESA